MKCYQVIMPDGDSLSIEIDGGGWIRHLKHRLTQQKGIPYPFISLYQGDKEWKNYECIPNQGEFYLIQEEYEMIPNRRVLDRLISLSVRGQLLTRHPGLVTKYGPIEKWWLGPEIRDLSGLFCNYVSFNADLSGWDVGHVLSMNRMFANCQVFECDLGGWDVSQLRVSSGMFSGTQHFQGSIGKWDMTRVETTSGMFEMSTFNQDLSRWRLDSLQDCSGMFWNNPQFNHDLSGWNLPNIKRSVSMLSGAKNYSYPLPKGIDLSMAYA